MSIDGWEARQYNQIFEAVCRRVQRRRQTDPDFTLERLRGILETQYVYQGQDWVGRGAVANTAIAATIAAYEHLLAEWEQQRQAPA
jgi:hypothetical protein